MGARRFEELDCWRLSRLLKLKVYAVIRRPAVARDFKFCDQIRESSRSAPNNIAEGFGRYRPAEFAHFLRIAKASLIETLNHLIDAEDNEYISHEEQVEMSLLGQRALGATVKLIKYLEGRAGGKKFP